MDVTLTVVATATGASADLHVTSPDTAPATPLLDALRAAVAAVAGEPLTIDGRSVAADGTAADCALADGAMVCIGEPIEVPAPSPTDLVVVAGPDAGRRLALTDGEHVVGRDPDCELVIDDVSISRRHLLFSVASGTTRVTDLDSANGTTLDLRPLPAQRTAEVGVGASLKLGDSHVCVVTAEDRAEAVTLPDGHVVIHRAPRLQLPAPAAVVEFPALPTPAPPVRVPVLAAGAPVIAGVVLAVVLHQWQFLAFTALSPIMILGQAASDHRSSRRNFRRASREHAVATTAAQHRLVELLEDERRQRYADAPDLAELTSGARNRSRALWSRAANDPDAVVLRLGRGDQPSRVQVVGAPGATVVDVPICAAMPDIAVLGLCGPRNLTTALARSLIIQAATLHSPAQLRLVVLAPGNADDWAWVRWLPHLRPRGENCSALVGFDDAQVAARVSELKTPSAHSGIRQAHTLVVVDGTAAMRGATALATLTESAGGDTSLIWCAGDERDLPGDARAIVTLSATPRAEFLLTRGGHRDPAHGVPDLVAADVAAAAARALAPLRDSTRAGSAGLPLAVRWEQVADVDLRSHRSAVRALTRHWSRGPSTAITLGRGGDEPATIDLRQDGPHMLVAGTTGSGKSELLLSLVASLAARNRPDQLSLLLIDHKGGAAFGPCARLPHTVGVVTDLDAESTKRALLSLTAEIRRREALFAAVAATDLESYSAAADGAMSPSVALARLVIVVDEFATLAEEQPDFVGGLVGIAQRGRSLGVHLVLATQRPDGVVSADIRANTRLRICLGVARENESRDVIDCPDAVTISRTTPGRAYLRVGPGDLREFQTARIGGDRISLGAVLVTLSPAVTVGSPPPMPAPAGHVEASSDLDMLIAATLEVSATLDCSKPPPPWLPPLPDRLAQSTLPNGPDTRISAWGLQDLPATGEQRPLTVDLRTGSTTLIAGAARSGRTTAARAIVMSTAARRSPAQLQVWIIDASAGLADLAGLAHCGAVVGAHDLDRMERLLAHLTTEIARRRHHPSDDRPDLMLIVDSWEGLAAASDDRDGGRIIDTLLRLAVDGPAARLHLVITTDRGGLVGRLGGAASHKIVLRTTDPGDFALIGLPAREVPRHLPPGRGIRAGDLALVQVALPDEAVAIAARRWPPAQPDVRRFDPLPQRVSLAELLTTTDVPGDHVVIGLRADDLASLTIGRRDIGTAFMIVGAPGSGRSTALALLARQLTGRRVAISCPRRSSLLEQHDAIHLPRDDQDHATALLDSLCSGTGLPPDILVDDVDLLAEGPLWARLEDLIRNPSDTDQIIAISGSIDAMLSEFRGPLAQARRAKVGLLLSPSSPHHGEMFGIRLPRRVSSDDPPGRGWLANRGTAIRVQLADPGNERHNAPDQPRTEFELSGLGLRRRE